MSILAPISPPNPGHGVESGARARGPFLPVAQDKKSLMKKIHKNDEIHGGLKVFFFVFIFFPFLDFAVAFARRRPIDHVKPSRDSEEDDYH